MCAIEDDKKRSEPAFRYEQILFAAIELAREIGYKQLTRNAIADHAGVSPSLVSHYLGTIQETVDLVLRAAIDREVIEIVAQGLTFRNEIIRTASRELRDRAAMYVVGGGW